MNHVIGKLIIMGKLFVISAPSGAGKTTIVNLALDQLQETHNIERVITCTSRKPRGGEIDKQDYNFLSREEFEQKLNDGFFIEHAIYANNYYGSPISILDDMKKGKSFFSVIDLAGAKQVSTKVPQAIFIWISPPNMETLAKRLKNRGTETDEQIERRLNAAIKEMEEEKALKLFQHHIINNKLEVAVEELVTIIDGELRDF
jgi:guanylate kinase